MSLLLLHVYGLVSTINEEDKNIISSGEKLTDKHINFAQEVLKMQFPGLDGLKNTLLLTKHAQVLNSPTNYLQIVHVRTNHWIAVSTLGCLHNRVRIYDSLYTDVDEQTTYLLKSVFGSNVSYEVNSCPRQEGCNDCGLFAIANCVSLVNWSQPERFDQKRMRPHLVKCFEQCSFTKFPGIIV